MILSELKRGESARIVSVGGSGSLRQHFLDMGLIPGKTIKFMKAAPMGDPIEYRIRGYELTLRLEDAAKIEVQPVLEEGKEHLAESKEKKIEHPGLGEMGKVPCQTERQRCPRRPAADLWSGGKSKLRKDHFV